MSKTYAIDMCEGSILPKMLRFAIPLMCSSILQLLFNAADVVVVGRFCGDNSMAAVGSTTPIINLMTNLFMGLSIGANVLVAKYYGAKEEKKVHEAVHTAVALSILSGFVLTVIGLIFTKQILMWMNTPEDVFPLASKYLKIYFLGIVSVMLYNFCNSILRAVGDTKRPLYYLMFAGVINVVLNLFFVIICKLDVAGVALATIISQCVSAFLIIRCLCREQAMYQLFLGKIKFYGHALKRILHIGIPSGIYGTVFSLSNVVIQSSVNSFGATVMAGNAAAMNIEGFVYMAMNAFHQTAISFVSQNYGAGKIKRIWKIAILSQLCVIVTGLVLGQLTVLFGGQLLGIYSSKNFVIEAGLVRLKYICGPYFLCGMMDVMVGILRGLGRSVIPTIVSMIGACGLRLVWIFTIFAEEKYHTTRMLYLSYPLSWSITTLAHVICFLIVWRGIKRAHG
ncbi:MAG: MATE family efflux transporter [Lachnospiraceae bacterium]|nr:MATE family efflux transporter [Lachnospiraceae bacterium]